MAYDSEPLRKIAKARNAGFPVARMPSIPSSEAGRPRSKESRAVRVLGLLKRGRP